MPKQAIIFVFTDWHLKNGKPIREVEDWPPFAGPSSRDNRSIRQIAEDINQRLDNILPSEFPPENQIKFSYLRVGPEVIETRGEPHWDKVWGAILDRNSVGAGDNAKKLQKMGQGFKTNNPKELARRIVVATPQKKGNTPKELIFFLDNIDLRNASNSDDLVAQIAGWLAGISSVSPQVRAYIVDRY